MEAKALLAALFCAATAHAGAADPPEIVQRTCVRCHGDNGVAAVPDTPHLDGQLASYLLDALDKHQKGKLPTEVPDHVPARLSLPELTAIAEFYAGSKASRPKQEADGQKVARGEVVFRNRCEECHPDNGREGDKDGPRLAAQNLPYMLKQIRLFVSGKRKFGFLQDEAYKGLSDADLEAVAHFFAAQDQVAPPQPKKKKRKKAEEPENPVK